MNRRQTATISHPAPGVQLYQAFTDQVITTLGLGSVPVTVRFTPIPLKLLPSAGGARIGRCVRTDERYMVTIWQGAPLPLVLGYTVHELRHVEQMYRGWWVGVTWCGVAYRGLPYQDRPWEIDARAYAEEHTRAFAAAVGVPIGRGEAVQ